ncbi:MAG TPA: cytidine deaminase [Micromonosporaceae bacterium]|nr:cytidine deaminase [Micromonosporaceae bacterium]
MPDAATDRGAGLSAEDAKLVTLARAARARTGALEGAAVRDGDGRTYAGSSVHLPSLTLTALQFAVASAVSAGATVVEAAAVVSESGSLDVAGRSAVRDVSADAPIHLAAPTGDLVSTYPGSHAA